MAKKTTYTYNAGFSYRGEVSPSWITLIIQLYFLYYLLSLERIGCQCALTKEHTQLKTIFMIFVGLSLVDILLPSVRINIFISGIISLLSLYNMYLIYIYIRKLRKEACSCSDLAARSIMETFNYVSIFGVGSMLIFYVGIIGIKLLSKK